jgi:ATP-dependent Lhr-like helicase
MLRKPPHILITTPESMAIALNAPKFSLTLENIETIIIDEVHALAENKRGTHLSLSLERLTRRIKSEPQRIGLSATVHPLNEVASFVVGLDGDGTPRNCTIVDVNYTKEQDIEVISPVVDFIYTPATEVNSMLYATLDKLISSHKTTLIFTNTRSATERVVFHLKNIFKEKYASLIGAHHSSLSKEVRLEVENKLKVGDLKAVVTSTSLELGIDIGYVDLVILLGSPKSVTRAIQRIGRSGHSLHEISKGRLVVMDRDDLIESIVLAKNARTRELEKIHIPKAPLDVLSQHIVGMSLEKKWNVKEAFEVIKRSYSYSTVSYEDYLSILRYLSGMYTMLSDNHVYGKIWFDEKNDEFGRRGKMTRAIYYMNSGTIPDEVAMKVYNTDTKYIGKLEEEFVEKLLPGDVFVLGGTTYKFIKTANMRVMAEHTPTSRPTVPQWFSEMLPLHYDLAVEISKFRESMSDMLYKDKEEIKKYLIATYKINEMVADATITYFMEQVSYSVVPEEDMLLVEEVLEGDLNHYIFHSMVGRRANDAISRTAAYIITSNNKCNVRVSVNDNGFMITLPIKLKINDIKKVFNTNIEDNLKKALENSEIIKRRFRHACVRGFLILKRYNGNSISVHRQQFNSEILIKLLKKYMPDFPILKEAYREVMEDAMDIDNARIYWNKIKKNKIKIKLIKNLEVPSPFGLNVYVAGVSDIILMNDKKGYIQQLHKKLISMIDKKG